jgi:hypothetical protein
MMKAIWCPDGTVIRGKSDDELIAGLEAHFVEAHPELVGLLSREEILVRAVDDGGRPAQRAPRRKRGAG